MSGGLGNLLLSQSVLARVGYREPPHVACVSMWTNRLDECLPPHLWALRIRMCGFSGTTAVARLPSGDQS